MIWVTLAFIAVGLLMIVGSGWVKQAWLATVVLWVGIALLIVGLILLLTPVLVWLNAQIRAALAP